MDDIIFDHVSFTYPETETEIFHDLSLVLSPGVTTLVGQNGTGKTTLLLLASGILLPTHGKVYLQGIDTVNLQDERARQRYVSLIFQNMEFETEEPILTLLHFVYTHGFRDTRNTQLIEKLIQVFELEPCIRKKTQEISKGELQRTILAFSLLYGSQVLMMDEPIFALEDYQKQRVMAFLLEFVKQEQLSLYYSVHELELSRQYSDYAILFQKHASPLYGSTREILTREHLERAYETPMTYLKQRETIYRDGLKGLHTQKWN